MNAAPQGVFLMLDYWRLGASVLGALILWQVVMVFGVFLVNSYARYRELRRRVRALEDAHVPRFFVGAAPGLKE